ncbi:hypothetical protein L226DRAFT_539082 [Lentinus tigrinus ALCF2SS1-7]|uniref:uncharacterized protein n=1 Tax=Lentinus tigrinus ALCF2SS1-7 TaxID=1328758 RepID=UPI001165E189|nr:hypothetical protein L226DRAFT_539082 [Lentinus tigrinus ALCF2SS1-7]
MAHCERCDRWFKTAWALQQHKDDSGQHHVCDACELDFASAPALAQHYAQSARHPYCQRCEELFDDWEDLYEHYGDAHHYCDKCNRVFDLAVALADHRRQKHDDDDDVVCCSPCKRTFKDANALQHHHRSTLHQGRTVACPMQRCTRSFVSRAALVLHLESGACPSRITRAMVNRIVAALDTGGVITNPARLIGDVRGGGGGSATRSWATEHAWNGTQYECYVCHRTFATLPRLDQHLGSPAHAAKTFRCPAGAPLCGCGAEFRTLSGFCQHVESEQCGVQRFILKGALGRYVDGTEGEENALDRYVDGTEGEEDPRVRARVMVRIQRALVLTLTLVLLVSGRWLVAGSVIVLSCFLLSCTLP